jgi:hypothetical protein
VVGGSLCEVASANEKLRLRISAYRFFEHRVRHSSYGVLHVANEYEGEFVAFVLICVKVKPFRVALTATLKYGLFS